jgi:hypothetical protein
MNIINRITLNFRLKKALRRNSINNTIVLVFANLAYLEVLNNWLFSIKKVEVNNYLIIALDSGLYSNLRRRNIPVLLFSNSMDLKSLWINRIKLFHRVLKLGYSFIHSDADAVWLHNPLKKYFFDVNADIVFSQGTIYPMDTFEKNGFVLCCGYFGIKHSSHTIDLLDKVLVDVFNSGDDQVSFNHVINLDCRVWTVPDEYYIVFRDKYKIRCSDSLITGFFHEVSIAVLPHKLFQRINIHGVNAYVKHLLSEKESISVVNVLQENDLYFINSNKI